MKNIYFFYSLLFFLFVANTVLAHNAVVSLDGSGDYKSIQEAIDAAPSDLSSEYVIFIKKGIYKEKIFINKKFITLLGEDRTETVIEQAILRRQWIETNTGDYGAATINIQDNITDLTLANLTVKNNFADVYPDFEKPNDHSFTIRGGAGVDRVKIVNCNIISTGGDTLSLWNTAGGRFYHADCHFEGYVDYVCPRGYCFIEGCTFYGYNTNASIWHDGAGGKDHKLVVRNSWFDGVENFGLGRYHRMAAFYLLDCNFANQINNRTITYVGDSVSSERDKLIYGKRIYYNNCHRLSSDYDWHKDNLSQAEGNPSPEDITSEWTFNDTWNPKSELKNLFSFAILPTPAHGMFGIEKNPALSWFGVAGAVSYDVYFGTEANNLNLLANTSTTSYVVNESMSDLTTYYWRADAVNGDGKSQGQIWHFTTGSYSAPDKAFSPIPTQGGVTDAKTTKLSWSYNQLQTDTFILYFGENPNELPVYKITTRAEAYVYSLKEDITYYWRVDTKNKNGSTTGDVWNFKYENPTGIDNENLSVIDFQLIRWFPNPADDEVSVELKIAKDGYINCAFVDLNGSVIKENKIWCSAANTCIVKQKIPSTRGKSVLLKLTYKNNVDTIIINLK